MLRFCLMLLGWFLADLLFWLAGDARLRRLPARRVWRIVFGTFIAAQLFYLVNTFVGVFADDLPDYIPLTWHVCAYLWHLLLLPVAILGVVIVAIFKGGRRLFARRQAIVERPSPAAAEDDPSDKSPVRLTRREALMATAVALPPLATAVLSPGAVGRLGTFRIQRRQILLPTLPADLDGLTIAHVTDLHIGRFLAPGMIERVADATNELAADIVVYTGDLNDITAKDTKDAIDFMRRLDPRHGLAMVEGNHDVMNGADLFEQPMLDAGMPLLLDQAMLLRVPGRTTPVQLLGINWGELMSGKELGKHGKGRDRMFRENTADAMTTSMNRMMTLRDPAAFPIVLAHHPHTLDPAAEKGFPLVLAGHTHGGQVMLTEHIGAGPLRFKYWTGEYKRGSCRLFVNNGVGNWFPLRYNAPAEIVHLTLRRDTST